MTNILFHLTSAESRLLEDATDERQFIKTECGTIVREARCLEGDDEAILAFLRSTLDTYLLLDERGIGGEDAETAKALFERAPEEIERGIAEAIARRDEFAVTFNEHYAVDPLGKVETRLRVFATGIASRVEAEAILAIARDLYAGDPSRSFFELRSAASAARFVRQPALADPEAARRYRESLRRPAGR